ncbi:MAG: hydantoinase B/oxoprolinase family protein [Burkholderiales bacterium]|nr:hydantoinase B/oxoprolinase family protein [Burkholderiales bacterium]
MVDPITLEVIQERLISIVREMRATLARVAYSSVLYEARDFSCVVMNARGDAVAVSEDNPGHIIPLPWSVRIAIARFGDDIHPGDVILINDPYSGGTHLNDVAVICPVFVDGKLLLFPAIRAHWADVGGMTPGSLSGTSTEIFQEGVRIPPIKIYERGKLVTGVADLMFANMRVEPERRGDLQAMLETCRTAERRIVEMVGKFGMGTLLESIDVILDRTEEHIRELVDRIPDGSYVYEDYLDASGTSHDPVLLKARIDIAGSDIKVDFTGTAAQVAGPINASLAVTTTAVFTILKTVLDPDLPVNQGAFRPVTVTAPLGTILNARFPAACGGFAEIRRRTQSVVMGALSRALPDAIAGDVKGTANHCYVGGLNPATNAHFIFYEYPAGGTGGYREADGSSAFRSFDEGDFSSIQPVESIENELPIVIERTELRVDSGGAGTSRGGLGIERDVRLATDRATYSVLSDRCVIPPYGVHGGGAGAPNSFTYRRGRDEYQPGKVPGKATGCPLVRGDVVLMRSAGGGGFGDPLARDPERVRDDVATGYVTIDAAGAAYGVVLTVQGEVDVVATRARRAELAARRTTLAVAAPALAADEYRHGRRYVKLNPATAARLRLAVDAPVELVVPVGAPLRAWIDTDAATPEGELWIGAEGGAMIGVVPGDRVEVRALPLGTRLRMAVDAAPTSVAAEREVVKV